MAIYYIDPVDGDNANDGLSFPNRRKTLGSTITSNNANEYRIIETPGGLVSSNTTWTTQFNSRPMSFASGTNLNASGGVGWQITINDHGFIVGDYVYIYGFSESKVNGYWEIDSIVDVNNFVIPCYVTSTNQNTGGTRHCYKITNQLVKLDSPKTKNLSCNIRGSTPERGQHVAETWGNSSNIAVYSYQPSQVSYDAISQARILQLQIQYYFQTGRAAWHTFAAPLDLTGYRQLSLWFMQTSGNTSSYEHISIRLCSDTNGNTPVYEFKLPATSRTNYWAAVTIDCDNLAAGLTMTTPINSIAIYVNLDRSTSTFRFQHIIACKAQEDPECLSHNSVISTKREGDIWWPVHFVDEDQIHISSVSPDTGTTMSTVSSNSPRSIGYWYLGGTFSPSKHEYTNSVLNEMDRETGLDCYVYNSVNTFMVEKNYRALPTSSGDVQGAYIYNRSNFQVTGGWNRTDMSTRADDAISWYTNAGVSGTSLWFRNCKDIKIENLGVLNGDYGLYIQQCENVTANNIYPCKSGRGIRINNYSSNITLNNINCGLTRYYGIDSNSVGNSRYYNITATSGNALYYYMSHNIGVNSYTCRNVTTTHVPIRSRKIYVRDGDVDSGQYFLYTSSGFDNFYSQDSNVKNIYGFQKTTRTTGSPLLHNVKHHNINKSLISTWENDRFHFEPENGYDPQEWTKRSNVGYGGHNTPIFCFGYDDNTYAAGSAGLAIQNNTDAHSGSQSMRVNWQGGGTRSQYVYDVAVTDASIDQYAYGKSNRILLCEFSVSSTGTVTATVQCKRESYDNDHIDGNLYISRGSAGNEESRSPSMTTYDQWEEMTVETIPSTAGIIRLYLEIRGYYSTSSNQPVRSISVDTITCTQS